jgi:hypothetical protein
MPNAANNGVPISVRAAPQPQESQCSSIQQNYNTAAEQSNAKWWTRFWGSVLFGGVAGGAAGANARTIGTAAAENYPTLIHGFLTWLNRLMPRGGTVTAAIATVKAAPGQIKDACSALQ